MALTYTTRSIPSLNIIRVNGLTSQSWQSVSFWAGTPFQGVEYFTTLATWDPAKVARHRLFIKANEAEGVRITYGEFKRKQRKCPERKSLIKTFEEKQTDVNIAIRLFELAAQDRYDNAIIVSGDTDLIPAVGCSENVSRQENRGGNPHRSRIRGSKGANGFSSSHEVSAHPFEPV